MLFNSYPFIFVFLPLALAGYEVASRFNQRAVVLWLGFISLVFYGWSEPALLLILLGSVLFNYTAAALIGRRIPNPISPRTWLYAAIVLNLVVLGYYKYSIPSMNFFSFAFGLSKHWANVVLPLGISFFTFTQIAFLIDLYKKSAKQQDLPNYLLFVTFFPHLIAGPILHHREMMPQFQRKPTRLNLADFSVGGTWFVMGLAKKVLIADTFAGPAVLIFQAHGALSAGYAWTGALAYTLQLYFDFSGYSDMALGLARMFSIEFPLNFNSPYKSASIIEVWQRWHMTLGRYIFTYIYNPVTRIVRDRRMKQGKGMSRRDRANAATFIQVVALPLTFTMFIAGIWHGAGLQFMVFGLLHGIYMSANNAWRQFFRRPAAVMTPKAGWRVRLRHGTSVLITFICIVISLVFFRADSVTQALSVLAGMFGLHSFRSAATLATFSDLTLNRPFCEIAAGLVIVWFLPNTQQILTRFKPSLQETAWNQSDVPEAFCWSPSIKWAITTGVLLFFVLVELQETSTFLYFQF